MQNKREKVKVQFILSEGNLRNLIYVISIFHYFKILKIYLLKNVCVLKNGVCI